MSYKIIYDDLWVLSGTTSQSNEQIREIIESLIQRFQSFLEDDNLQGETMQNMKTYVQEVHGSLLQSIAMLMAEYDTQLLLYKDGYFNIDSNLHAELPETSFEIIQKELKKAQDQFIKHDNNLYNVEKRINDLVLFSVTKGRQIKENFSNNIINIKNFKEKIGEYEQKHEKDLNSFTEHLNSLKKLVKYYKDQNKNAPIKYQSQDIAKIDGAREFISSYQNVQTHLDVSHQRLDEVIKREEGRIEALKQEAIEARKKQANQQVIKGLLTLTVGIVAIAATAGAATPLVATIGVTSGFGTTLYGASQMDEGLNSRRLAFNGDITTKAFNPLRDTIFLGSQKAYDFVGGSFVLTSTMTSVFVAPVSNLMASGNSLSQASVRVGLQNAGIVAASYTGGKLAESGVYHLSKDVFELTESQSKSNAQMAQIFGSIMTGIAVASPIQKVVTNKFGVNTKIDDSFSKINADIDNVKLRNGIWKEKATDRGKEIDRLMGNNLGSNYPVIDKFENGVATSIKSRDLTSKSYQNGNTLERIIKKDIDKLSEFKGANWNKKDIKFYQIDNKILKIVVPNTSLTDTQIQGINNAIKYGNDKNIIIKILVGGSK